MAENAANCLVWSRGAAGPRRVVVGLNSEIAGRAGWVLNDKLLSKMIRQVLADDARHEVVAAARRKRDDPVHRPRRIGLRPRDTRYGRQRGSARRQMQKISAGKFHLEPPFTRSPRRPGRALMLALRFLTPSPS